MGTMKSTNTCGTFSGGRVFVCVGLCVCVGGDPTALKSCPVTPVANPKVSILCVWCNGGRARAHTHTHTHSSFAARAACMKRLHTCTHIYTHNTHDGSLRFVPDVTCSLTKFRPLHHSFKIAKSVQRNYIFTHSDISWRSSDAVAPLSAMPVRLLFTLCVLYDHKRA